MERFKSTIASQKRELEELKKKYETDITSVRDLTEIQVRQEIVQEIQKRKQNGESEDSQIYVMLENIKSQYAMMELELQAQYQAKVNEYELLLQEFSKHITDVEEENNFLSQKVALLTGNHSIILYKNSLIHSFTHSL